MPAMLAARLYRVLPLLAILAIIGIVVYIFMSWRYTPARAKEIGSDYIVVGRPITQAADPVAAYRRCVREFVG